MNWNVAEQLPETAGCRNSFNAILASYINAVHQKLMTINRNQFQRALSQPNIGLKSDESVVEYAKEIISGEMSQNLFQ